MSYRDAVIFIIFTEVSKLKPDKVGLKDTYIVPIHNHRYRLLKLDQDGIERYSITRVETGQDGIATYIDATVIAT